MAQTLSKITQYKINCLDLDFEEYINLKNYLFETIESKWFELFNNEVKIYVELL